MRHVKVRRHEIITCMQGHACGAMLRDLERDDPINSSDFLCTGDLHPNLGDWKGYECPECSQAAARFLGLAFEVHVQGRGWIS